MSDYSMPLFVFGSSGMDFHGLSLLAGVVNERIALNPHCGLDLKWADSIDDKIYYPRVIIERHWLTVAKGFERFLALLSYLGVGDQTLYFRADCNFALYTRLSAVVIANSSNLQVRKSQFPSTTYSYSRFWCILVNCYVKSMSDKRLWIIFLIIFVNLLGFGIILPLMPYYVESFGAGPVTIGLLASAYSFFQLFAAPILGEISDKIGRRPVLLFSIGGTAISFVLMGAANSIAMLFVSRIVDGISGGNISTAQAYIADVTTKEKRTQGMGMMMAAFSLGFIIGPALGGYLSTYGYSVPAYVAGGVAFLATILTFFFLPESRVLDQNSSQKSAGRKIIFSFKDFYDALTHPNVGLLITLSFLIMFSFSLMQGTFALFTEHALGLTAKDNGYIFAYIGVLGITMQFFGLRKLLLFFKENVLVTVAICSMAFAFVLFSVLSNVQVLLMAVTFLAFGNSICGPVIAGLISKLTPDHEQGNVMGINQSVNNVAQLIGPLLGTFIYSELGQTSPYVTAACVLVMTAILATLRLKEKLRPTEITSYSQ